MNPIHNPHFESRDLALLVPEFAEQVRAVLDACLKRGVRMTPFFTVRGPGVQARLWCQSRTQQQIRSEMSRLAVAGAPWLGSLLRTSMGTDSPTRDPKLSTARVTQAPPGTSWHQWGEAVDCFVTDNKGGAIWDASHFGYQVYAEEATKAGLEAGLNWSRFPDAVHVQRSKLGVSTVMQWPQIEERMIAIWKARKDQA